MMTYISVLGAWVSRISSWPSMLFEQTLTISARWGQQRKSKDTGAHGEILILTLWLECFQ